MNRRILLSTVGLLLLLPPVALAQVSDDPLQGKIGGSIESFAVEYGASTSESILSDEFDIDGFSTVLVSEQEGIVDTITLFAPRDPGEEWDAFDSNVQNWTLPEAHAAAMKFLPEDAVLADPFLAAGGDTQVTCTSQILLERVPESVYAYIDNIYMPGQCSYVLLMNDDDTQVTWISVDLEVEDMI